MLDGQKSEALVEIFIMIETLILAFDVFVSSQNDSKDPS